ncbi:MAG: Uma2 family endonuclease [Candidatus Omnitrophota bacterium]
MPLPKLKEKFTYQDYCTWPDEERWELIDGRPYDMSPAPFLYHQTIAVNFTGILRNALLNKPCKVYVAPSDVVLSEWDVVQPDVFVVCDKKKITEKNIQGAPDLIIEILSPSTAKKDRWEKKNLYEKFGVREYLLADPDGKFVERFWLGENGRFDRGEAFDAAGEIALKSLPEITISLRDIFEQAL